MGKIELAFVRADLSLNQLANHQKIDCPHLFDYWLVVYVINQAKIPNIHWCQPFRCEDSLLFCVCIIEKEIAFGFWLLVGQNWYVWSKYWDILRSTNLVEVQSRENQTTTSRVQTCSVWRSARVNQPSLPANTRAHAGTFARILQLEVFHLWTSEQTEKLDVITLQAEVRGRWFHTSTFILYPKMQE